VSESFAAGLVGITLDERYRLDALLGEGGMGAVFRAHHLAMDRKVAVKLLKPHLTSDDTALQRFAREARSTMKVDSDHAVKVLDFGITPHKDYYMVLEYLDGRTVQRELDVDGPFSPARVVHIARQSLRALGAAHAAGLVHRDVKPENILLMRQGEDPDFAKMLDFGVAKLMEGAAKTDRSQLAITQAGMVFGTPEFMSPEQACGQTLDGRSDLYSLAATMFAMLTGCGMFKANAPIEWLTHHARTPPPHLTDGLPALAPYTALDQFLQRCLAKKRDDRPKDAEEMIRMLDRVEPTVQKGASGAEVIDASATLLPESQNAAAQSLARLPKQSDAISAFTQSASSQLVASVSATDGEPPTTTGTTAPVGNRRALWLVLGAAAVLAMIVTVVVVASSKKKTGRDPLVAAKGSDASAADPPPVTVDAAIAALEADAGLADAGAVAVVIDAGTRPPGDKKLPTVSPEVAAHLAAAEDGKRTHNNLKQLSEADAALQGDPRNVRARFLAADALITGGDLDRGCAYLRMLGKNPAAVARARQASCPTD